MCLAFLGLVAANCAASGSASPSGGRAATSATTARASAARHARPTSPTTAPPAPGPNLAPGSDPSVLPGPVLIADRSNNRLIEVSPTGSILWEFPRPGDLAPGQTFKVPDDAFFTPDGKQILVTEEDNFVISLVDVASHRIVWRYGTPGVHGSGPDHLWNPDDAIMTPSGNIITADIKNCRILVLRPPSHAPVGVIGGPPCQHTPPAHWGSPNGAFPMTNGHFLVTEINGSWVDELGAGGQLGFVTNPPGVVYPSDTNQVGPNNFLTVDYSSPGQIVEFDSSGHVLWRYKPSPPNAMDHPSLALPLPNGDVLCNDDYNNRVIVVDPRTNRVVWQYGHTGVTGTGPGYLYQPDGVDLAPPRSLVESHASTIGDPAALLSSG